MTTTWRNILLMAGAVIFAILICEIALRFIGFSYPNFYRYDLDTGATLREGAEGWYREEGESYVRINRQGMRDDREIAVNKPSGIYRIAVLGDSYAEALQVDVRNTFWRLLEDRLNTCGFAPGRRVEVLNFGVSGYSTAQELIALQRRVKPYQPDLVLLAFLSGNDVRDNSKEIAGLYPRPYFQLSQDSRLVLDESFREHWIFRLKSSWAWRLFQAASDYSRVVQLLNKVKNIAGQPLSAPNTQGGIEEIGLDDHIYLAKPPAVWERAWQLTEALVAETRREAERQGARFLLVTLTNPGQVLPDAEQMRVHAASLGEADLFSPERRMQALAAREGIEAIFLAEPFARSAPSTRYICTASPTRRWVVGTGTSVATLWRPKSLRHNCVQKTDQCAGRSSSLRSSPPSPKRRVLSNCG